MMTGITISIKLKHRLNFLEDITFMLRTFMGDINYYHRSLSELISDFKKNEKSLEFITECASMLDSGADFPDAWSTSIERHCALLKKEEKVKLIEYGKNLGKTDTDGQKLILETYYMYFVSYKTRAADEFNKYNRTVIASFFFLGCGLFILMI